MFLRRLCKSRLFKSYNLTKLNKEKNNSNVIKMFYEYETNKNNGINLLWNIFHEQQYYSKVFKTPVVLKHINVHNIVPKGLVPYIMYSGKLINWRRYKIIHSNEIIEILFISLWLKNLTLFMKWVRKFFEKNDLKKHKKLVLLLNSLLANLIWGFNIFLGLRGLRASIRGKFGKAGSVRKSRRYIKRGKCSYTSKNIAMISQTKVIRTSTGVFSIKLEVFY